MEKQPLSDFVSFAPGINPTRAEEQFSKTQFTYYDQTSFTQDYYHTSGKLQEREIPGALEDFAVHTGDVVISNSLHKATLVHSENSGKILSLNFTRVNFTGTELDKHFFIYLFNEHADAQRQKDREIQNTKTSARLPLKGLRNITIPIVPLKEQLTLGQIYRNVLTLRGKLNRYAELLNAFAINILEDNLKEK
ncbi:restriction endonuclease subunit S [Alloscardovia sp. HMSC034E08]|uniref:restriction endonuclease subunit S n=1 Tax=Alloscardovia sp. HMSC034E08 TaxID=1739413 RepID=UPI0008F902EE|nr:restriction endonuclease subunit S [Alloscardovia sp. HMSC034E08]